MTQARRIPWRKLLKLLDEAENPLRLSSALFQPILGLVDRSRILSATAALFMLPLSGVLAQTSGEASSKGGVAKPTEVKKLDGTMLFGVVEITDDYTIRVTNDSGITKLPIASLAERDFRKYGFSKDRSKDGRFWYERKEAVEAKDKDKDKDKETANAKESDALEMDLKVIPGAETLLKTYEQSLGDKKAAAPILDNPQSLEPPLLPMFSGPGALGGNLPQAPFSVPGSSAIQPAVSTGGTLLESATGAAGGVPALPK